MNLKRPRWTLFSCLAGHYFLLKQDICRYQHMMVTWVLPLEYVGTWFISLLSENCEIREISLFNMYMLVFSFYLKGNMLESLEVNNISHQWTSNNIQQIRFVVFHFSCSLNIVWYLMSGASVSVDYVYLYWQNVNE